MIRVDRGWSQTLGAALTMFLAALTAWAPAATGAPSEAAEWNRRPWGRFGIGSWKQVRVFTETLGQNGQVESLDTKEIKTTLDRVDDWGYRLKVEVTMEVAGKRFQAEPKYVAQGFYGESPGQTAALKSLGTGDVTICGRRYPCQIRQVTVNGEGTSKTSTLHCSDQTAPYVLKSETKASDAQGVSYESWVEVLAVEMPSKVLTEIKPSALVSTVHKQRGGTSSVTIEVHCIDVPGHVVSHTSKELDAEGRVVRRSTLELVDYEVRNPAPETSRVLVKKRLFQHLRARAQW